jgi:hypothetical protein
MSPDYSKRDYLLPKGCKDLIDVVNLPAQHKTHAIWPPAKSTSELTPITGEILVSEKTTVGELATLLGQQPFRIIADLLELGIFANVTQTVDFEMMCKVARKYGYKARNPV